MNFGEGATTSLSASQLSKEDGNEETIFEKKASGKKKRTSKQMPQSSSQMQKEKSTDIQSTTLQVETEEGVHLTPVSLATGMPSGEVCINIETSDSTLPQSLSSSSATSEPPVCSTNETSQSGTPVKSCSAESLSAPPKLPTSESADMLTCSKDAKTMPSTSPLETADHFTLPDESGSASTVAKSTVVTVTSESVVSLSTSPMDLLSSSKDSQERTDATNSSTESCKTPVAPSSDVMITMDEDDDKLKSPLLISENESSSAELIYVRGESTTETKVDVAEKIGPCSEVMKTNDNEGAHGDNDDMAMKDTTGKSKRFVPSHFNDSCKRLLHNDRSTKH